MRSSDRVHGARVHRWWREIHQVINGHFYCYQEEWSNQARTCQQRLPAVEPEPKATFTVTPNSGTRLNFNAAGFQRPWRSVREDVRPVHRSSSGNPTAAATGPVVPGADQDGGVVRTQPQVTTGRVRGGELRLGLTGSSSRSMGLFWVGPAQVG